jgi:hypothetical protein
VTVRWETAAPIREAELKARDVNAPAVDDKYYAIAVYGISDRLTSQDSSNLKKQMTLKRDGKKDLKPDRVRVIGRDDGMVIVYMVPRTKEISKNDGRIYFDAQIGRLHVSQTFFVQDMVYNSKLEL